MMTYFASSQKFWRSDCIINRFSHERELNFAELKRKVEAYFNEADFALLEKAFLLAEKAHAGQKRSSGEDISYILSM